jgi:hypothetical protein
MRTRHRTIAWLAAGVAAIALLGTGVAVVLWPTRLGHGPTAGPSASVPPATLDPAASPPAIATSTGPFAAGPVAPPRRGAFLGSWVRPPVLTQPARAEAVSTWEQTLGRRLDIVNTYRRIDDDFFESSDEAAADNGSTMMLSWATGDTRSITGGRYDDVIHQRAREARSWRRPILMRLRWEMDRPNLRASMWSGPDYIAAWKYTRDIFRAEGATNVSWVWCPTAEGFAGGYAQDFYPGDADVDWACVDVYAGSKFAPLGDLLRPFLEWGAQHPSKPLMLGEFGVARAWGSQQRAAWLRNASAVVRANPQIRAALYFESNPDNGDGPYQEFRLADDPPALAAFQTMAREPYFNPR